MIERIGALEAAGLDRVDADKQATAEWKKLLARRDPFAEFGSYSGLSGPMTPRPW